MFGVILLFFTIKGSPLVKGNSNSSSELDSEIETEKPQALPTNLKFKLSGVAAFCAVWDLMCMAFIFMILYMILQASWLNTAAHFEVGRGAELHVSQLEWNGRSLGDPVYCAHNAAYCGESALC